MHRIFGGSNDFLKVFPKNRFFENFTVGSSLKAKMVETGLGPISPTSVKLTDG